MSTEIGFIKKQTIQNLVTQAKRLGNVSEPLTPENAVGVLQNVQPEGGSPIDAFIEGTITEVSSNATKVATYKFYSDTSLVRANFPNVTSIGNSAFYKCSTIESVELPSVTSIEKYGFRECTKLSSVNVPNLITVGESSFYKCSILESIDLPKANRIEDSAFSNCTALKSVSIPNVTYLGSTAFGTCQALTNIKIPKVTSINGQTFKSCIKLTSADFSAKVLNVSYEAFINCYSLKALVLRYAYQATMNSGTSDTSGTFGNCYHFFGTVNETYNPTGAKDGYIYVPKSVIDKYKTATNWVVLADQFRALEDYTVDGTITGELDPNKVPGLGTGTLTWNGNTTGLTVFSSSRGTFYKVSDAAPEGAKDNVTVVFNVGSGSPATQTTNVSQEATNVYVADNGLVIWASADTTLDSVSISKGTYFVKDGAEYVSSITVPGFNGYLN